MKLEFEKCNFIHVSCIETKAEMHLKTWAYKMLDITREQEKICFVICVKSPFHFKVDWPYLGQVYPKASYMGKLIC